MENRARKTSGIMAVIISVISFSLLILSVISAMKFPENNYGMHPSFAFWIYSMIFAYISLVFYLIDALHSINRAFKKIHPTFNIIFALMTLIAIPIAVYIGGGVHTALWYAYYIIIFIMEILSIIKHHKIAKESQ